MMKTLYLSTLAAIFLSINTYAQPTLSMNDIGFQVGDLIEMDSCNYVDMSTMTGPNMNWDFSDLIFGNTLIYAEMLAAEDVESAIYFEGANRAHKLTIDGFEFYQFYGNNANDIQYLGNYFDFSGTFSSTIFENTEKIFSTPMTYGSTSSDTYNSVTSSSLGSSGTLTGESSYEIVGYGTLLLNGETHTDVLLMHLTSEDEVVSSFGGFDFESTNTDDAYLFFKAGYHFPLLAFSHSISDGGIMGVEEDFSGSILLQQTTVGLEELETIDFNIYPNPVVNNEVTIQFAESMNAELEIYLFDPLGRKHLIDVSNFSRDNNGIKIYLPNHLSSGIYQLIISGENMIGSETIVIE